MQPVTLTKCATNRAEEIAIVGATFCGTRAGGDFPTHARYMQEAFRDAPAN